MDLGTVKVWQHLSDLSSTCCAVITYVCVLCRCLCHVMWYKSFASFVLDSRKSVWAFSAFTQLVGLREGHPARRKILPQQCSWLTMIAWCHGMLFVDREHCYCQRFGSSREVGGQGSPCNCHHRSVPDLSCQRGVSMLSLVRSTVNLQCFYAVDSAADL